MPPQAQVLVHQIWLGKKRKTALESSYSAEELNVVQRDIGRLAQYTIEMGGDIELLERALQVPPWEPLYLLSAAEIERMRLSTVQGLFNEAPQRVVPARVRRHLRHRRSADVATRLTLLQEVNPRSSARRRPSPSGEGRPRCKRGAGLPAFEGFVQSAGSLQSRCERRGRDRARRGFSDASHDAERRYSVRRQRYRLNSWL